MRKIRLRTKSLVSLLGISAILTVTTLVIVGYIARHRLRASLQEDLHNSVVTYQGVERQRNFALMRAADLLANLPDVRVLLGTQDTSVVQATLAKLWHLSGSDLLVVSDQTGNVAGFQAGGNGFEKSAADQLSHKSPGKNRGADWWFDGSRLYQTWVEPIYSDASAGSSPIGFLVVGRQIDQRAAKEFSNLVSSDVAFQGGDTFVASTLNSRQQRELSLKFRGKSAETESPDAQEIFMGAERYFVTTIRLSSDGQPAISLTLLKSSGESMAFLSELNRFLLGMGTLTLLVAAVLALWISDTFTRPLARLISGVRALEDGDFDYPLESEGGDEIAEVTGAFDRMRTKLQKNQSEQRLLQERLRQAHKMEAVGRLAGGVAHDFNNLLMVIRGNSDLLVDRHFGDDSQRRNIEQIQKAADRAVSLTRQLLAFSRMQVLEPRVLDLNAIVSEMGTMLPRLIGEHIEYIFLADRNLAPVKADPGQMEQVIMNLAVNARDAMKEGGTLTIQTRNVEVDEAEARSRPPMIPGSYVLLQVTDTGHGMNQETMARIFDPFFTTKEVGKGTGLGLATVYGVVKQSGGFIWVNSEAGKGARFEMYLPQSLQQANKLEAAIRPSFIPRGSETILVVEDEEGVRELACQFLKVSGYSVLEAKDGVEALGIAKQFAGTIHLVLSDMVMPRMGGTALARQLKIVRPNTKIVLMSGYSEFTNETASPEVQQIPVLQKPFSRESLVKKVREALGAISTEEVPIPR